MIRILTIEMLEIPIRTWNSEGQAIMLAATIKYSPAISYQQNKVVCIFLLAASFIGYGILPVEIGTLRKD